MIWRCPTIRFLDYQKVKDVERNKANELFGTLKEPSALASKVSHPVSAEFAESSTRVHGRVLNVNR